MEVFKRVVVDIPETAKQRLADAATKHNMSQKSLLEKIITHVTGRADGLNFLNPIKGKANAKS